jgi:hypothetical protein
MNLIEMRQPILENESNEYENECLNLNYKRFQTLANLFKEDSDVSQYEDLTLQVKSFWLENMFGISMSEKIDNKQFDFFMFVTLILAIK